mgnify:CR=1 FL=1
MILDDITNLNILEFQVEQYKKAFDRLQAIVKIAWKRNSDPKIFENFS